MNVCLTKVCLRKCWRGLTMVYSTDELSRACHCGCNSELQFGCAKEHSTLAIWLQWLFHWYMNRAHYVASMRAYITGSSGVTSVYIVLAAAFQMYHL